MLVLPRQSSPSTCGQTCLWGVLNHLKKGISLSSIENDVSFFLDGGTSIFGLASYVLDNVKNISVNILLPERGVAYLLKPYFLSYLLRGGTYDDSNECSIRAFITYYAKQGIPLIAGVDESILYDDTSTPYPEGHFIIILSMGDKVSQVADSYYHPNRVISVPTRKLIKAIRLGYETYDGYILAILDN